MKKFLSISRIAWLMFSFTRLIFRFEGWFPFIQIDSVFVFIGMLSVVLCIKDIPRDTILNPVTIFTVIIMIVSIISTYIYWGVSGEALERWLTMLVWFTLFLRIPDSLYSKKEIKKEMDLVVFLLMILTFASTIASYVEVYQEAKYGAPFLKSIINRPGIYGDWKTGRFSGIYGWPTMMGLMNLMSILASCYLWKKRSLKPLLAVNIFLQGFSLIKANSRSPMVATALVVLCSIVYFGNKANQAGKGKIYWLLAVFSMAVVAFGVFYIFNKRMPGSVNMDDYNAYLATLPDPNGEYTLSYSELKIDSLSSSRFRMWKEAILSTRHFPHLLIGWGLNNFDSVLTLVYGQSLPKTAIWVHNAFVQSFLDAGLLGLVSFVGLVILMFRAGIHVIRVNNRNNKMFFVVMLMLSVLCYSSLDLGVWFLKWFHSDLFWLFGGYLFWLDHHASIRKRTGSSQID